ncbi:hypothetical protein EON80_01950 [bacterium]|nr:MAG: hypothetical protein EON80_01950 [bacterium]
MKNRILWIFDSAEPQPDLPPAVDENNSSEESSSFVALPWAMFGAIGAQQQAEMQRKYQLAYERTLAQQEQKNEEALRFERLLADLEIADWGEED